MHRALVVDDDERIRNMYTRLLDEGGYEVQTAGNGEEATKTILKDRNFDVVLLDIDMPVIGGAAVFDFIKWSAPRAKVIVTSVYDVKDQKQMIRKADAYYDKSDGTKDLMVQIKKILPE